MKLKAVNFRRVMQLSTRKQKEKKDRKLQALRLFNLNQPALLVDLISFNVNRTLLPKGIG